MEGEEEARPWVPQNVEMEQEVIEAEVDEELDADLQLDPQQRNLQNVAEAVRRRLVDFLAMNRPEANEEAVEEPEVMQGENQQQQYQLLLPF